MKTDSLNFNRIGLLFKKFFVEQKQRELIFWSIMVMVFMLTRNFQGGVYLTILIGGMFYIARFFRDMHSPTNGNAFFMLPASQLEKLIVGFVIGIFYYLGMMIICYSIGNLLGTFFNNLLAEIPFFSDIIRLFQHRELRWVLFETEAFATFGNTPSFIFPNTLALLWILIYLQNQSIYLLGSIYFKRNQVWKTLLSTNLISTAFMILLVVELFCFKGSVQIASDNISAFYGWGKITGWIVSSVFYILPPFLWIVSYFRLTEKQV